MSKLILLAVAAALLIGATTMLMMQKPTLNAYPEEVVKNFQKFCSTYHKYMSGSDPDIVAYRLGVYYSNWMKIQNHNAKSSSYTMGENQFMDITNDEFKKIYLGLRLPESFKEPVETVLPAALPNVDWTKVSGRTTGIKDQGQCGSCWAFSSTGGIEGIQNSKFTGKSFSEQQLVSCSSAYGNMGCNGGLMDYAFEYVVASGITLESSYSYTSGSGTTGTCKSAKIVNPTKIGGYQDVPSGNCNSLASSLQSQPISIGVDAETWQFYSGGVFDDCGTSLDHGVTLVGASSSGNYWNVKNSWGTSWGESGFIRLAAGNTCGLCNTASFPTA